FPRERPVAFQREHSRAFPRVPAGTSGRVPAGTSGRVPAGTSRRVPAGTFSRVPSRSSGNVRSRSSGNVRSRSTGHILARSLAFQRERPHVPAGAFLYTLTCPKNFCGGSSPHWLRKPCSAERRLLPFFTLSRSVSAQRSWTRPHGSAQ